jgi:cysteine desulfurase
MSTIRRNNSRPGPDAIYLDYQATTPLDPRVLDAMLPYFGPRFGNPHSTGHAFGHEAADAVEEARMQIASVIGAEPREIIFTSGATESNNLAIKGAARFLKDRRHRIVTLATEHKCVLESVRDLAREGFDIEILPVEPSGLVDLARLEAALDETVALLSVMAVNNEIGVIQDLAAIGALCRSRGVLLHSDAAQAFGKVPIDVQAMRLDLVSISGHKIYAPKGIGALYVRRRPRVRLEPLLSGGGQERGFRSGTLAPALCVGLGVAAALAAGEAAAEAGRLAALSQRLRARLGAAGIDFALNGDGERRLSGNLNLSFPGVGALDLMAALPDLALSTGSACSSAEIEPSYVLTALGVGKARAEGAVRIGFGRFTTADEIDRAAAMIAQAVRGLAGAGGRRHIGEVAMSRRND